MEIETNEHRKEDQNSQETKALAIAPAKRQPNFRTIRQINLEKFIEPSNAHVLFGDICISDNIRVEDIIRNDGVGVMAIYNSTKRYERIVWDERNKVITIYATTLVGETPNWRFALERLRSLGDRDAKKFSDLMEIYCTGMEMSNQHSQKVWNQIEECFAQMKKEILAPAGKRGYTMGTSLETREGNRTQDIQSFSPQNLNEMECEFPINNDQLSASEKKKKVQIYLEVMRLNFPIFNTWEELEAARSDFLASLKFKHYTTHHMQLNVRTNGKVINAFQYSKSLLKVLGYKMEDLQFDLLRKGVLEIIWSREYYNFYSDCLDFFVGIETEKTLKYHIRDRMGMLIDAEIKFSKKTHHFGVYDEYIITTFVSEWIINPATLEKVLQRRKAMREKSQPIIIGDNKSVPEGKGYLKHCENFCDAFYPNSFPNNYRAENHNKICSIKPLVDPNNKK